MYRLYFPLILSLFSAFHAALRQPDPVSRTKTISVASTFTSIRIFDDINIFLKEGDENQMIVKNEEDSAGIRFYVKDFVLNIRTRKKFLNTRKPMKMIIVAKTIHDIRVDGNSELRTVGELSYENLKLEISGDGYIYANTKAREVNTIIRGLGKIEVTGNFKKTQVNKDADGNMITTYN